MTGTQPSEVKEGPRAFTVASLHTRLGKTITSKPTPQTVTYTRGSASTLRPQSSRKLTPVTAHTPQGCPAQASRPSSREPSAAHVSLLGLMWHSHR